MKQRESSQGQLDKTDRLLRRVLDDLTVIIPTVGRPILQRCLQSIADGTVLPARIIAIDQGDNLEVADWLHSIEATRPGDLPLALDGKESRLSPKPRH